MRAFAMCELSGDILLEIQRIGLACHWCRCSLIIERLQFLIKAIDLHHIALFWCQQSLLNALRRVQVYLCIARFFTENHHTAI